MRMSHLPVRVDLRLLPLVALCCLPATFAQVADDKLPAGAKLVFEDTFDRAELGSYPAGNIDPAERAKRNWCVRRGKWEIRAGAENNGYLWGAGGPADVILERTVGPNFRLEYTAWSPHPGDRSAFVCVPQPNFEFKNVYDFHFGSNYSQNNALYRQGQLVAGPVTAPLPVAGMKSRVVIQKVDDLLQLLVDGMTVFAVRDPGYARVEGELSGPQGLYAGLFTWSEGVAYDDLKLYNLPGPRREPLAEDARATYTLARTFEPDTVDRPPAEAKVQTAAGCSVTVRDEPTVVFHPKPQGHSLVSDHCLTVVDENPAPGAVAAVTVPLPSLASGEVEAELLATSWQGECATVSLVDGGGGELAAVVITADGSFMARTADGEARLLDRISYLNRPPDGRLCFQPGRWFTLRLSFNAEAGVYQAAIVNLYAGLATPGISWLPLGSNLLLRGAGPVCGLKVTTGGRARLLVDNLLVASPRAKKINDQSVTLPLRTILGLTFPLRKDPFSLAVYSLRNEAFTRYPVPETKDASVREPTALFLQAAVRYDSLLIRLGYLQEHAQQLSRMAYHLRRAGRRVPSGDVNGFLDRVAAARDDLEGLLRTYGNAYRDAVNEQPLKAAFFPGADRLTTTLASREREARALSKQLITGAGGKPEPAPALAPGPYDAPLEFKHGRFERGGKPTYFYPPVGVRALDLVSRDHLERALQLDNCWDVPFLLDPPSQPAKQAAKQSFPWDVVSSYVTSWTTKDNPAATMYCASMFGCVHVMQLCPAWWLETHREDSDIFFASREGKTPNWEGADKPYLARPLSGGRYAGGGGYWARLNFWNEEVRQMYRDMMDGWSRHMSEEYPDRVKLFALGLEQTNFPYTESGFNESAIRAFRQHLQRKYGTIAALNTAWGTAHGSFDDINPRECSARRPNGLLYDFQVFRQDGYCEWMKLIQERLRRNLPDLATMNDFNWAFGGASQERALDLPRMFRTYDIVGSHFYGIEAVKPMYRCGDSLRKAYGNPLGNFEWAAGLHLTDLFNEDAYKACGLLDMWEEMAWGKSVLSIWYGGSAGFSEGAQYFVPNLRQSVLRYSTTFCPVGRLRSRRFGEIAQTYPTVTPQVAILEPTTSKWNGLDVYTPMLAISVALEQGGWNYGFVYEAPLLEGKQSLSGIQTLIVPRGVCLQPAMADRLLPWIRQGGTLIAVLPPGMLNQYGRPDGRLLREVTGSASQEFSEDFSRWSPGDTAALTRPASLQDDGKRLCAQYGQGRLIVFTRAQPLPTDAVVKLVAEHTPRDFSAAQERLRLVGRESARHLYLFVVNPDVYETAEDRIVVSGKYGPAVDLGCDAAFPVKTSLAAGVTSFDLRLAPGEGTVIRLEQAGAR